MEHVLNTSNFLVRSIWTKMVLLATMIILSSYGNILEVKVKRMKRKLQNQDPSLRKMYHRLGVKMHSKNLRN